jgi:hypothetical protein
VTFFRSIGGSFGVAMFGAIFNAAFSRNLGDLGAAGAGLDNITGTPQELARLPEAVQGPYIHAFADALDTVFLVAVPFALIGFGLALLLREVPLRTDAGALAGVSESFGMARTGAAEALEETTLRVRAARAAVTRLDELVAVRAVPAEQVAGLRQLFDDRIAYFAAAARRVRAIPGAAPGNGAGTPGDEGTGAPGDDGAPAKALPDGWGLLVELLQVERAALADSPAAVPGADDAVGPVDLQHEADTRVAAARAALARLDEVARDEPLPAERVDCLRSMFEDRIAGIEQRAQRRVAAAGDTPSGYWAVAVDVLETERRELARYTAADEVSAPTAHRIHRDLTAETAALVS